MKNYGKLQLHFLVTSEINFLQDKSINTVVYVIKNSLSQN